MARQKESLLALLSGLDERVSPRLSPRWGQRGHSGQRGIHLQLMRLTTLNISDGRPSVRPVWSGVCPAPPRWQH